MPEYEMVFSSVADIAKVATKHVRANDFQHTVNGDLKDHYRRFADVANWAEVERLAVDGWESEADRALEIAESAINAVEQDHDLPAFNSRWDVTGSEVDVARYLAGEPENMIDFEMVNTPRSGRVIVLCASGSVSGAVSADAIKRRGHAVAALAFALSRMGFATELWLDLSAKGGDHILRSRVLVKGANDDLDTARIMFAYSHPAMLRALGLPSMHAMPKDWQRKVGVGSGYGTPVDPKEDLPEGTIYLPSILSDRDVPDADEALLGYLRLLDIITD